MLFILHIDVYIPPTMPQAEQLALRERETARATELIEAGTVSQDVAARPAGGRRPFLYADEASIPG